MSQYNRTKLELTDLSPESVSNIFLFLHSCLENNLTIKYFQSNLVKYSNIEQYFILFYAKVFFSNSYNSYLNRWMNNQAENFIEEPFNTQMRENFNNISSNAGNLITYLNQIENTVRRQAKKSKKSRFISEKKHKVEKVYDYRIPLYFKTNTKNGTNDFSPPKIDKKTFKNDSRDILIKIMDSNQFEEFFNNSFYFQFNSESIKLLSIEMGNAKDVYSQFYQLYQYYKNEKNHQNKIVNDYYSELIKNEEIKLEKLPKDFIRRKFIRIPKIPVITKVTRFDIMKIMYNTFPQIRESANEFLSKNPKSNLDAYLKTKSRNIKNA